MRIKPLGADRFLCLIPHTCARSPSVFIHTSALSWSLRANVSAMSFYLATTRPYRTTRLPPCRTALPSLRVIKGPRPPLFCPCGSAAVKAPPKGRGVGDQRWDERATRSHRAFRLLSSAHLSTTWPNRTTATLCDRLSSAMFGSCKPERVKAS